MAKKQVTELPNDGTLITQFNWKLSGAYPDVPLNASVDLEEIKQIDDDPVFLTLPLMKAGMKGDDGFKYTEAFVDRVLSHIQNQGSIANMGHIPKSERSSSFPMPKALWVGGVKDAEGMLWGKAYLTDPEFRTLTKQMKATNTEMATSVYGTHDISKAVFNRDGSYEVDVNSFKLESIDFAPAERAALKFKRGKPILTSHMENDDMTKEELLAQITVEDVPQHIVDALLEQFENEQKNNDVLAQMRSDNERLVSENERLSAVVAQIADDKAKEQFTAKLAKLITVDTEEGALKETISSRVLAQITAETTEEQMDTLIADVTSTSLYTNLAKIIVAQMSGGDLATQGGERGENETMGQKAEKDSKSILNRMGINFG